MARFILTAQLRLAAPTNIANIVNYINRGLTGVSVNVNINTRNINSQLNTINKNLNNTSRQAKAAGNDIERFGEQAALSIRRYGAFTLATTSFIRLTRAIQSGIDDAIKFDREMVRIAQVTGNTVSGLKDLNVEVTRLSQIYGVASSHILESAVTLAQAGQSAKQVKTILESLAKTGVSATFGDIKDTTEAVIAIMQQFNLKAEDMEGTLSSINKVSAKFAVESEDITTAVIRTGGAFQTAGGNIKEFQALFTSVRQTTRESAETIATGFRTIFTRLQRSRTQNFLQSLGIDLKDVEGQFVGPYEAVRRLSTALKDLQTTDPRFAQIIEELGGFRQISKVIPLVTKFDVAQQALNVSLRGGNSLTEDADAAQQSLAIRLAKVREEFLALIRNVSNNASFKAFIDLTLKLSSSLIRLADSLTPLIPLLGLVGAVKIGAGLGQFSKGFSNKIHGKADGGFVHKFASGGLVPGTGSGDTVPARLTPGEFVIRKNAVKAIGANNLEKVNNFAFGGAVKASVPQGIKNFIVKDTNGQERYVTKSELAEISGFSGKVKNSDELVAYANAKGIGARGQKKYDSLFAAPTSKSTKGSRFGLGNEQVAGRVDLGRVVSIVTPDEALVGESRPIQINGSLAQIGQATSSTKEGSDKVYAAFAQAQFGSATKEDIERAKNTQITANTKAFGLKRDIGDSFNKNAVSGVISVINDVINKTDAFKTVVNKPPKTLVDLTDVISQSAKNSIKGVLFEGVIRQAIGARIGGGADAVVDFNDTTGFEKIFQDGSQIGDSAEAKGTLNLKSARSTVLKTLKNRYGVKAEPRKANSEKQERLFANGGGVNGTDTVPAMLTPGEFVINKKAASKLGSTALNKLNKADKVQHFATGGPVGQGGGSFGGMLNPLSLGIAFSALSQFGKMLSGGNKDFEALLDKTAGLAFQFGVFKTVIEGAKSSFGGALHNIAGNDSRGIDSIREGYASRMQVGLDKRLKKIDSSRTDFSNFTGPLPFGVTTDSMQEAEDKRIEARKAAAIKNASDRANSLSNSKFNSVGNKIGRATSFGGAALGGIGMVAGSFFTDASQRKIASGQSGNTEAGIGGALSGAGTGAAVGAMFGPVGIAVGAVAGGIIGYTSAISTATKELENVKFTKKMEEFSSVLERFTTGKLSAIDAKSGIIGNTSDITQKFLLSDGEDRQNIKAAFDNESNKVEQFVTKLAESANDFAELEKVSKGLISNLSILTGLPYKEYRDQFTKQIDAQKKAAAFNKTADKLRDAERVATLNLIAMSEAIHTAASSFTAFDTKIANAAKFLEGQGGTSAALDGSNVLERAARGNVSDTKELDVITSGISQSFGEIGRQQADAASENARLLNALPELLLQAKAGTGFSEDEGRFEGVIRKLLASRGFSPESAERVAGGVRTAIGAEGKDEKIIDAIRNNLDQIAGEVGKPLQGVLHTFKEFAPQFKTQTERISSAFEIYTNAQIKAADIQQNIIKKDQNLANFVAQAKNKVRGSEAVNTDRLDRVRALAGTSNADDILAQMQAAQKESNRLGAVASGTSNLDEFEKLKSAQAEQNLIIIKANKALNELANESETLAEIQKELAEVEERRKEKNNIVDVAVFGSRQDKIQQEKALAITARAQRFGIDSVPEELRGLVKSTLESRGKFGQEELKRLKKGSAFGIAAGVGNIDEIASPGEGAAANQLLEAAKLYVEGAKKAEGLLQQNAISLGTSVSNAISNQNREFLTKLEQIFKEKLVSDKNIDIASVESSIKELRDRKDAAASLQVRFGRTTENKESFEGAVEIAKDLANAKQKARVLSQASKNIGAFNPEGLTEGALLQEAAKFAGNNNLDSDALNLKIRKAIGDVKTFNETLIPGSDRSPTGPRFVQRNKDQKQLDFDRNEAIRKVLEQEVLDRGRSVTGEVAKNNAKLSKLGKPGELLKEAISNKSAEETAKIFKDIDDSLKSISSGTVEKFNEQIKTLQTTMNGLEVERNAIKATIPANFVERATGGPIPGYGNSDTVPAMLTPGEFVMRKSAVQAIGIDNLYAMNNGYADGGVVSRSARFAKMRAAAEAARQKKLERQDNFESGESAQVILTREKLANEKKVRAEAFNRINSNAVAQREKSGLARKQIFENMRRAVAIEQQKKEARRLQNIAKVGNFAKPETGFANGSGINKDTQIFTPKTKKVSKNQLSIEKIMTMVDSDVTSGGNMTYESQGLIRNPFTQMYVRDNRVNRRANILFDKQKKIFEERNAKRVKSGLEPLKSRRGYNSGGAVTGGSMDVRGVEELRSVVERFSVVVNGLADKLSQFKDMSISLQATHKVDVTFNGAEVFSKLSPEFQKMAVEESKKAINNMLDSKFPDVGRIK